MPTSWYPSALLNGSTPGKPYAILVLNQPINFNALNAVIHSASLLVCADAGANRLLLYDEMSDLKHRLPDAIVGDLDSLSHEAQTHYESHGVQVVRDPDQYSTDFTKCLKWMRKYWNEKHAEADELDIVVLGGLGGRVDQGLSQIHHLYMVRHLRELLHGRIYLLSELSLSFVLDQGINEIHIEPDTFEENVGIIPILGRTRITTHGLEWDVEDWDTELGGEKQISTSNHIRADLVSIETDDRVPLFTMELAKKFSFS